MGKLPDGRAHGRLHRCWAVESVRRPVILQTYVSPEAVAMVRKIAALSGLTIGSTTDRLLRRAVGLPTSTTIDEAVAKARASE